jgi:hypothetical protein
MDRARSKHRRDDKCEVLLESLKGRVHLQYLALYGRIILKWILRKTEWEGVNWIYLAQDRYRWCALVNTEINLRIPYNAWNFLTSICVNIEYFRMAPSLMV